MIDGYRGTGNGLCLPAGPLREPISRLHEVDFIISTNDDWSNKDFSSDYLMKYKSIEWKRVHDNQTYAFNNWPLSKIIHAVAGIGNPQHFFNTLEDSGLTTIKHSFPDHYNYQEDDLIFDDEYPIIMTEKDAVRCQEITNKNLWYLKSEAELSEIFIDDIITKIKNINSE